MKAFITRLWEILSSAPALIIYICTVLTLIIILVVNMIHNEKKYDYLSMHLDGKDDDTDGEKEKEKGKEPNKIRFATLSGIDRSEREKDGQEEPFDRVNSLAELCDEFRRFCATELGLYYSIDDIRRFISGMAVSHLLIMQGMSGTGKTSLAVAFGKYIKNPSVIVPVQPMWKECTDLMGYYNEFTKKYNETVLLSAMYEAGYRDNMYIAVLDEMNIARVEYYFAEFLSLMELPRPEERRMQIISDVQKNDPVKLYRGQLFLPSNMWFIGTANNDDSTFAISDKVYDRAMIMNLDQKTDSFECPPAEAKKVSAENFVNLVNDAESAYSMTERNRRKIRELDTYLSESFHITFGNRIKKQMEEYIPVYVACGGEELDAIDDIVTKKVLRKLESQNPVYVRNTASELRAKIDELFGEGKMKLCLEYLARIERSV